MEVVRTNKLLAARHHYHPQKTHNNKSNLCRQQKRKIPTTFTAGLCYYYTNCNFLCRSSRCLRVSYYCCNCNISNKHKCQCRHQHCHHYCIGLHQQKHYHPHLRKTLSVKRCSWWWCGSGESDKEEKFQLFSAVNKVAGVCAPLRGTAHRSHKPRTKHGEILSEGGRSGSG